MTILMGWKDEAPGWSRKADSRELPPEQVIAWLRSDEGQRWSVTWKHRFLRHDSYDGVFATVLPDPESGGRMARWPEPFCPFRL